MDIEWTKPVETDGALKGYRVRYGRRSGKLTEILITDADVQHQEISDLEKGIEYEFRVSGINLVGAGELDIIDKYHNTTKRAFWYTNASIHYLLLMQSTQPSVCLDLCRVG